MEQRTKVEDGKLYVWDVDPDFWPEGMWIHVCKGCTRGPLCDDEVFCGDHNDVRPGHCIKLSHPHIK